MTINHAIMSEHFAKVKHGIVEPAPIIVLSSVEHDAMMDKLSRYDELLEKAKMYDEILEVRIIKVNHSKETVFNLALNIACDFYGQTVENVLSTSRKVDYVKVRYAISYCLTQAKYGLQDIADFLNRKDHTSILHLRDKVSDLMDTEAEFKNEMTNIYNSFKMHINDLQQHS
jgi:chromosomal replication initiation ATPase DnaA